MPSVASQKETPARARFINSEMEIRFVQYSSPSYFHWMKLAGPEISSLLFVLSELVLSKIGRSFTGRNFIKSIESGAYLSSVNSQDSVFPSRTGFQDGPVKSGETAFLEPFTVITSCLPPSPSKLAPITGVTPEIPSSPFVPLGPCSPWLTNFSKPSCSAIFCLVALTLSTRQT